MSERNDKAGQVVVITGAAGCIGFHTISLLIERDKDVQEIRCLDLREPNHSMRSAIETIQQDHNSTAVIRWITGDIRDINIVESILQGAQCVIHAASKVDIWTYWPDQDVDQLYSINVEGTENLLKTSVRLGVSKFIYVSSFETYVGFDTIYYATENTLPENKNFLFGASGSSKWQAEHKVRQYANVKLNRCDNNQASDQLLAVIVRFSTVYGEYDRYFISKIIEYTKFIAGGKLQRLSNVWIKQQSIYARNAAWSLIKAKQRLDHDTSISGEEFHITDDTEIKDPFDFVEPFLESHGMRVTKNSIPFLPVWLLIWLLFTFCDFVKKLDIFGIFTDKPSRYKDVVDKERKKKYEREREMQQDDALGQMSFKLHPKHTLIKRWYNYIMPQTVCFMCNSSFLNRTKASLRLDYEPIVGPSEALERSMKWYTNELPQVLQNACL